MPASPLPGATVILHPFVMTDGYFDALNTPLVNELFGSTVNVQPAELGHNRFEKGCQSVEITAYPTFLLQDIQISHVKSLVASMRAFTFDYLKEIITVTWSMQCKLTDSTMIDTVAEQNAVKAVKESFKMML